MCIYGKADVHGKERDGSKLLFITSRRTNAPLFLQQFGITPSIGAQYDAKLRLDYRH